MFSSIMTLDDAIIHCSNRAKQDCSDCAKEHAQLAEWLEELKGYRKKQLKDCRECEQNKAKQNKGRGKHG